MSNTIQLKSEADFDSYINNATPTLVDFWAPWCGPCLLMNEPLNELGKDMRVLKVNVDDYPELFHRYQAMSVPTMILFEGGQEKVRMVGARPLTELKLRIEQVLAG